MKITETKENSNSLNPKIIFLGTCSMQPSITRNVSGIFIEFGQINMIFDCGEYTYG